MEKQCKQATFLCYLISFINKQKTSFLALIFSSMILGGCIVAGSYISKVVVDSVTEINASNFHSYFVSILTIFVVYQIINNLFWRMLSFFAYKLQLRIKNNIISDLCNSIYGHSYKYFQDNLSGKISDGVKTIVDSLGTMIYDSSRLIISIVMLLFALFCMFKVHIIFFYVLIIWIITFAIISVFFTKKIVVLSENYTKDSLDIFGLISDAILNILTIQAFSRKKFELEKLGSKQKIMNESFSKKEITFLKISFGQGLYTSLLVTLMLSLLIILKNKDLVTIGDFVLILGLSSQITDHVWNCTEIVYRINSTLGMCNKCLQLILSTEYSLNKTNTLNLNIKRGDIIFDHVTFGYDAEGVILNNIDLKIKGGEKVALVGHSGSGKTTLINLLMGFYNPTLGKIYIDGADIACISQDSLRKNISYVSQDSIMFHRSILENINYGKLDASKEEIIYAATLANAHGFIESLPDGYDTIVGERGVKLSGGQRQRIAIARAILKNAPIFIMDEATSQIDSMTEFQLQNNLNELTKNKTVIIVAHKISTIAKMERIIVLDNGTLANQGRHDILIKESEIYKQLWKKFRS